MIQFKRQEELSIVNFSFKEEFRVSCVTPQSIYAWFLHRRQVELKESNLSSVTPGNSNITLKFGHVHLQYLSIDLTPVIGRRGSVCNKSALEIISADTTTWYQRDDKLKAQHGFNLKDRESYTREEAKQKRFNSRTTTVTTIELTYVNNMRVHITSRYSNLNQLIRLEDNEQDEEYGSG
ncbi:uncharacterized protein ATC70_013506 [Mucor velutinosus]|uniref:Uncharacterized protein n=1 Tax=Mucor velutinosus TaxID=708070 RepID=A0AAN7HVC2_9FUNG|nr:hypothetical protein ATC70_013506 [Mucor velutinosus]